MNAPLALLLLAAAPCPRQSSLELPGVAQDAVRHGCTTWVLSLVALSRVGPAGLERVQDAAKGGYPNGALAYDPARDRLLVLSAVPTREAVQVHLEARNGTSLALDPSWGQAGALDLVAPRKRALTSPAVMNGSPACLGVRPDGSALVVTRADSSDVREGVIDAWTLSPEGRLEGPRRLGTMASDQTGVPSRLAVAADGRALYATHRGGNVLREPEAGLYLYGLRADGRLDASFGEGGRRFEREVLSVAIAPVSGGWLVAGYTRGATRGALVRYDTRGQRDLRYGQGGLVKLLGQDIEREHPFTLATLRDGRALLGTNRLVRGAPNNGLPSLVRVSEAGVVDGVDQYDFGKEPRVQWVKVLWAPGESPILVGNTYRERMTDDAGLLLGVPLPFGGRVYRQSLPASPPKVTPVASPPASRASSPALDAGGPEPTPYRWVSDDGVEGFASSLDEVPAKYRARAVPFRL
jgi:hypothetical protein